MERRSFSAQVAAFAEKAQRRQLAIFRESTQRVAQRAGIPESRGGKMPVDTGNLRGSVAASTSGMPGAGAQPPELVLLSVNIGDSVWVGWTAAYAMRMEYGFQGADSLGRQYNQAGRGFLRAQIQNWDFIVTEVTAEARRRFP